MVSFEKSRDFYKVLQVPRTATIVEIKAAYRKLALRLHPDRHQDDPKKTAEFKLVNEAYAVLSNEEKKITYDDGIGIRYNKNRRTAPPPNYRKVYAEKKPPESWKGKTVDHKMHYDFHYGDGMLEELLKEIKKRARSDGVHQYHSPLGKGFSFSTTDPDLNYNPYSSASTPQGPPPNVISIDYEEAYVNMGYMKQKQHQHSKEYLRRYVRIVEDLHGRREQRRAYQSQREAEVKETQTNAAFSTKQDENCVIL